MLFIDFVKPLITHLFYDLIIAKINNIFKKVSLLGFLYVYGHIFCYKIFEQ